MKYIAVVAVLIAVGMLAWLVLDKGGNGEIQTVTVTSFATCEKAGYPIMESHPRQCKTPDGRTYAEEIQQQATYHNASPDLVSVDLPFPGAVTGKTFTVKGKARGTWYFEASFPVEVLDANGKQLVQTPAAARGEWMTTEFVPFSVEVSVPASYTGPATLILHKDNPSGMPENEASVSIPITIEY